MAGDGLPMRRKVRWRPGRDLGERRLLSHDLLEPDVELRLDSWTSCRSLLRSAYSVLARTRLWSKASSLTLAPPVNLGDALRADGHGCVRLRPVLRSRRSFSLIVTERGNCCSRALRTRRSLSRTNAGDPGRGFMTSRIVFVAIASCTVCNDGRSVMAPRRTAPSSAPSADDVPLALRDPDTPTPFSAFTRSR